MTTTLDMPIWVLDFDNDPNYEDNHNFAWTFVTRAKNHETAFEIVRDTAHSAGLQEEDITHDCIRLATDEDISHYKAMGGSLQ